MAAPMGSNGQGVKIAAGSLRAADIPAVKHCAFLIVVFMQLCTTQGIVWRIYMFKPHGLVGSLDATNGEVAVGAS